MGEEVEDVDILLHQQVPPTHHQVLIQMQIQIQIQIPPRMTRQSSHVVVATVSLVKRKMMRDIL